MGHGGPGIIDSGFVGLSGQYGWLTLGLNLLAETTGSALFGLCIAGSLEHQGSQRLTGYESASDYEAEQRSRR